MTDGSGKTDMAQAFASDFGFGDFDAAAIANGAFKTNAFKFAAMTFPIASGAEDAFAKKAVAFGFESAIVNGFGLFDFAVRPGQNGVRRGNRDKHRVEKINVKQEKPPLKKEFGIVVVDVRKKNLLRIARENANIKADRLQFFNENFERFRDTRGRNI